MYGGHSGSQGFLVYHKTKTDCKAVYGYYVQDEIVLMEGSLNEMMALKKQREKAYLNEKDRLKKVIFILFFGMLLMVIAAFIIGTFLQGLAALTFAAGAYMPILIIYETKQNDYASAELHQQFCRFHGCEHAVVNWMTKYSNKEAVTMERLKKMPIYDPECGTAYSGYLVTLCLVLAILIANITTIGLLKALGILLLTVAVLFINIFNPYNPYKLLQRPVLAQPTEREYALGIAIIERINEKY